MQEVGDNKTDGEFCKLLNLALAQQSQDGVFQHLNQHNDFYTAPSSCTYCAFTSTYKAMEAPLFQSETVIQISGCRPLREVAKITPKKFIAEENLHHGEHKRLVDDKVGKDNKKICTSNLPRSPQ